MHWKREDLAWFAGLFEGEGCVYCGESGSPNARLRWKLEIPMTDGDVVDKAGRIIGLGKVRGPYSRPKGRKKVWVWSVQDRPAVFAVLAAIWPWLGSRRKIKATQALRALPPVPRPCGRAWHEARRH